MNTKVIAVLASGRGSNLQAIIDNINLGVLPVKIGVVICDKADAYALFRAKENGIRTEVVLRSDFSGKKEFEDKISSILSSAKAELVVLAGFMRLLGSDFLKQWQHKVINIHPSLLPSFPGLHPQLQAIEYGARVSGCTVHFVDEGMDTGPIIMQRAVDVLPNDDEDSLSKRILAVEHKLYSEAIGLWADEKLKVSGRQVLIM